MLKKEKFTVLIGPAAAMLQDNIDTDAIFPVPRMKALEIDFAAGLFANLRYVNGDGSEIPEFLLNRPQYRHSKILVAGRNFGCGSSREHAVWGLLGFGIRCVIAPSFGDIFYNNSFKMGLFPLILPEDVVKRLGAAVEAAAGREPTIVDLESCVVTGPDGSKIPFAINDYHRRGLLEGLDEAGLTLLHADAIRSFQHRDQLERPWIYEAPYRDKAS